MKRKLYNCLYEQLKYVYGWCISRSTIILSAVNRVRKIEVWDAILHCVVKVNIATSQWEYLSPRSWYCHRRPTHQKRRNLRHTMIRHQNALAMFLGSACTRDIHPLNVRHFEYLQGVNASCKCTG